MKLFNKITLLVSLATAAFAGEYNIGPLFAFKGKVQALYVKSPDLFFVKIKDVDGSYKWAWVKENNPALSLLLSEKAAGGNVSFVFSKMPYIEDRTNNCHDIPHITWVCSRLDYLETVE